MPHSIWKHQALSAPNIQILFSKYPFHTFGEVTDFRPSTEKLKMSLECLVVPEPKTSLRKGGELKSTEARL